MEGGVEESACEQEEEGHAGEEGDGLKVCRHSDGAGDKTLGGDGEADGEVTDVVHGDFL